MILSLFSLYELICINLLKDRPFVTYETIYNTYFYHLPLPLIRQVTIRPLVSGSPTRYMYIGNETSAWVRTFASCSQGKIHVYCILISKARETMHKRTFNQCMH